MALTYPFKSALAHATDTWSVAYSVPTGKKSLVIECDVCNTSATAITFNLAIAQGVGDTPDYYILKDIPIPQASTLTAISGQKIVLEEASINTRLIVKNDTGNTSDVIISIIEGVD